MFGPLATLFRIGPWIVLVVIGAVLVLRWFVRLERRGDRGVILCVVLSILLFETYLWPEPTTVDSPVFHPHVGSFNMRLYELLIPAALLARLIARRSLRPIDTSGILLGCFFLWYAAAGVIGTMRGYSSVDILFSEKLLIYVGGGYILASGVSVREFTKRRWFRRYLAVAGVTGAVMVAMAVGNIRFSFSSPLLSFGELGRMGTDTASILVACGIFALVLGLVRAHRQVWLVATVPGLFLSVIASSQRAAMVGLGVSLLIVGAALLTSLGHRRLPVTPTEFAFGVMLILAVVMTSVLVIAVQNQSSPSLPFAHRVSTSLNSVGKRESAQERVNQWDAAWEAIRQQPVVGWGIGKSVKFYAVGEKKHVQTPIFHDIAIDLLVRVGIIGLVLWVVAVGSILWQGITTWRRHHDDVVAALALAGVAVASGLIAKGLVESIFEKYRLAVLLGVVLGMIRSAALSLDDEPEPVETPSQPELVAVR